MLQPIFRPLVVTVAKEGKAVAVVDIFSYCNRIILIYTTIWQEL
jgi:hypothetical protein